MKRYIDAEKLKAEIERLGRNWDGEKELQPASLFQADLRELLSIIDELQQEQSHFADADKMEQSEGNNHINLPERIFLWEDEMKEFLAGKRKTVQIGINQDLVRGLLTYIRYDVAQEVVQPEVDLEKEMDKYYGMYRDNNGKPYDVEDNESCADWKEDELAEHELRLARHFYELGLNARKEK